MYNYLDMVMTPIYQDLYFEYESLKTKVDQNSIVTGSLFVFELCFNPVISN